MLLLKLMAAQLTICLGVEPPHDPEIVNLMATAPSGTSGERPLNRSSSSFATTGKAASGEPWATSLPTFASQGALDNDPEWKAYLEYVYGANAEFTFPIELPKFDMFYKDKLPTGPRQLLEQSIIRTNEIHTWATVNRKTPRNGDAFDSLQFLPGNGPLEKRVNQLTAFKDEMGNSYKDYGGCKPIVWVYHFAQSKPCGLCEDCNAWSKLMWKLQSHAKVNSSLPVYSNGQKAEVYHMCCDDPQMGFWMTAARGSGLFVDLGRTTSMTNHLEIAQNKKSVLTRLKDTASWVFGGFNQERAAAVALLAEKSDHDTVQFTHHCEAVFKFEILDLREARLTSQQNNSCPVLQANFFTGWAGKQSCSCVEKAYVEKAGCESLSSFSYMSCGQA